ncbi:MAG: Trm112 family protein [Candidatus Omnitrophica bacterium]|nr:Trm112 family protein [Candidatus Omnitrophota bacterium]
MIDKELLKILACPQCKNNVSLKDEKIICAGCGRQYPIKNGIPVMLVEEAEENGKTK